MDREREKSARTYYVSLGLFFLSCCCSAAATPAVRFILLHLLGILCAQYTTQLHAIVMFTHSQSFDIAYPVLKTLFVHLHAHTHRHTLTLINVSYSIYRCGCYCFSIAVDVAIVAGALCCWLAGWRLCVFCYISSRNLITNQM